MNETIVCVVGNVATQPVYRESAAGPSARFRLAVTARYWDRERNVWTDGPNFFTVWAKPRTSQPRQSGYDKTPWSEDQGVSWLT